MQDVLTYEQQQRLQKGYEELLKASNAVLRATNDVRKFPQSSNYKRSLKIAQMNLSRIVKQEIKFNNTPTLF